MGSGEREGAPHGPGTEGMAARCVGRAAEQDLGLCSRELSPGGGWGHSSPPSRLPCSCSPWSSSSGARPCCSSRPFWAPFAPVSQHRGARCSLFPHLAPEILCSSCLAGTERGARPRGRPRGLLCPTVPLQGPQSWVRGAPHPPRTIAPAAQVSGAAEPLCPPGLIAV